ncbi:hypothetical protein, partial [Muriicola sp.]
MKCKLLLGALCGVMTLYSQPEATSSKKVMEGIARKEKMGAESIVKNIPFKNIGPTVMSGRVVDID